MGCKMRTAILMAALVLSDSINPTYVPSDGVGKFVATVLVVFMVVDFWEWIDRLGAKK